MVSYVGLCLMEITPGSRVGVKRPRPVVDGYAEEAQSKSKRC
jgi:hypothetical protein